VPATRRSRALAAQPEEVWRTAGDPRQLARWWPKVVRVEAFAEGRFTEVLQTERGRDMRADWVLVEEMPGERWCAAQELEGTPFERVLSQARKSVQLQPAGDGTLVTLELRRRMRGLSRLGGIFLRKASSMQLDSALDALESIYGPMRT
jgi:uncharacterized protein YndB with AHSA1/START domain